MLRLISLIYSMAAPTLMGVLVLTVLVVPELAAKDMSLILPTAIAGAILAMPISYIVAKAIMKRTGGR